MLRTASFRRFRSSARGLSLERGGRARPELQHGRPRLATARSAARVLSCLRFTPRPMSATRRASSRNSLRQSFPSTDRAAQFEALARIDAFGTTGLYDAVVRAIELTQPAKGRRALVLLSDGVDRYSTATAERALEQARRSDVIVYPVAVAASPSSFFERLAVLTGGGALHVPDPGELSKTLRRVARAAFSVLLGYVPPATGTGGTGSGAYYCPCQAAGRHRPSSRRIRG